ncbi:MAG: ACP S-malonyltransferase [Oligoflexia bacterium]|nr:ACP S-malonyltransferase [Oligoflexia bacterium]
MKKFVALFPGQGSQHVGMAKDLVANFRVAAEVFEEASDATQLHLKKLCFDGPESDLTLTENTQPCLLAASVAAFRVVTHELGFRPSAVAGHSLGEYSALVAAEALPLATAARWVRERGRAMQAAVPAGQGTMAAVLGMDDALVEKVCAAATAQAKAKRASGENSEFRVEAVVEPANFNAPGQIVIAGSIDAIQEALAVIKSGELGSGKAMLLPVSAPFHCRLMSKARDRMAELFTLATGPEKARTPLYPYVPNRTARLTQEPGAIFEFLVEQVDHPVLWKQSVTTLLEADFTDAVEFGPGTVLAGLNKRISREIGKPCASHGVADSTGLKALETALKGTP